MEGLLLLKIVSFMLRKLGSIEGEGRMAEVVGLEGVEE